jgi:hypothetical protein
MLRKFLIILSIFAFTGAANAAGVNIGISGNLGAFVATGEETEDGEKNATTKIAAFQYAEVFAEAEFNDRIAIGIAYMPGSFGTDTVEETRADLLSKTDGASSTKTNKVQVDFEGFTTGYVRLSLTDNFFAKVGFHQLDAITNESLGTGSKYNNETLEGYTVGMGYDLDMPNGFFVRAEANYMQFDGISVTSTTNTTVKIAVEDVDGVGGKLSVGKSF